MKKLCISDLDGTLLCPDGHISSSTVKAVNSLISRGLHFTFATARSIYSAAPITSALDINVPCILMNGVSIYDLKLRKYVKNEFFSAGAAREIAGIFREYGINCFMYKIHNDVLAAYFTEITSQVMNSFAEERKNRYGKPFVQCSSLLDEADGETVYFTVTGSREELLTVRDAVSGVRGADLAFYEDTYTGKHYLEVFSHRASKANGVKFLRSEYGFDSVTAFGDNLNDLSLFSEADVRVAVENAKPELKKIADHIAASDNEDGVAKWLTENERNILK